MKTRKIITVAVVLSVSMFGLYILFNTTKNDQSLAENNLYVTGLSVSEAEQALEHQNLTFMVENIKEGKVIDGDALKQKYDSVPSLVGMNINDAAATSEQLGLTFMIEE